MTRVIDGKAIAAAVTTAQLMSHTIRAALGLGRAK
jgi:hypothetical protein